ncbi:ProQ/FINO family protein [Vibrio parahaemolyticus]|uniref:ProQ/FINO family protein n=1 Tax=Vibrio parahaemolyticus TaxID=670 RepID=UPI003B66E43E
MAQIIIKKRRTLSLLKDTPLKKEEDKLSREELDRIEAEIKQQRCNDCKNWILSNWPEMFNKKDIKPLALGIHRDIAIAHKQAGGFEVLGFGSAVPVKRFLSVWIKRKAYQRALAAPGSKRFNLSGRESGPVSAVDREHAAKRLEVMKAQRRSSSQKTQEK